MIYFITGSKNKLEEVKAILPEVEQLDIDLLEIQELDPQKIIEYKLEEARKHHEGEFIVEDTGLYLDGIKGLPGPLIKWFMKTIGNDGISQIAANLKDKNATARTVIGYSGKNGESHYFVGEIKGTIVNPRGETNFGWDPIFQPDGYDRTFAEITQEEKNKISMRKIAVSKLKEFLTR